MLIILPHSVDACPKRCFVTVYGSNWNTRFKLSLEGEDGKRVVLHFHIIDFDVIDVSDRPATFLTRLPARFGDSLRTRMRAIRRAIVKSVMMQTTANAGAITPRTQNCALIAVTARRGEARQLHHHRRERIV